MEIYTETILSLIYRSSKRPQMIFRPDIKMVIHYRRAGFYGFLHVHGLKNPKIVGGFEHNYFTRFGGDENLIIHSDRGGVVFTGSTETAPGKVCLAGLGIQAGNGAPFFGGVTFELFNRLSIVEKF